MNSSGTPHLEALLIHEDFLRRIARSILTNGDSAEDAVQETWLRAVRSPPHEDGRSRAWLAVVTANISKSLRRRATVRRRGLETIESEAVDTSLDPAAIVEREQVRKRVVDAVLALEPKARDAVLLMYFEGLTPKLGAQRLGIPVNTFLSRVHRARIELRRRLLDEADDREQTARMLGTIAARGAPMHRAVGYGLRIAVTALLTASLTGSIAYLLRSPAPALPTAPRVAESPIVTEPLPVAPPDPLPAPVAAPRVAATESVALRGVVRDAAGLAVAGAHVSTLTSSGRVETVTQKDGAFTLALTNAETVELEIESAKHLGTRCLAHPSQELDVVLQRGAPLRGLVRDVVSGRVLADVRISVQSSAGQPPTLQANSDESGAFAFMAPARPIDLIVSKSGYESLRRVGYTPRSDGVETFELMPSRADSRGFVRVLDLEGRPVTAIESQYGTPRALGGGVFEVDLVGRRGGSGGTPATNAPPANSPFPNNTSPPTRRGVVWIQEIGVPTSITLEGGEGNDAQSPKEVRLSKRASIHGVVRDAQGKAISGARVIAERIAAPRSRVTPNSPLRVETLSDAKGGFRFEELAEATSYRVTVSADLGTARVEDPITAMRPGEAQEIVLDPGVKIGGQVVDASGKPVAGARLTVRATHPKDPNRGAELQVDSNRGNANPTEAAMEIDDVLAICRVGTSDTTGRFEIEHVPHDARIEVEALGHASMRNLELSSVRAEALAGKLSVKLGVEHVLLGKVQNRSGLPLAGAFVSAQRVVSSGNGSAFGTFRSGPLAPPATRADGSLEPSRSRDSERFETTTRLDGSFELRGLSAATYHLEAILGSSANEDPFLMVEARPRNEASPQTLTLPQRCSLQGRAIDSATGRLLTDYSQSIQGASMRSVESSFSAGGQLFQHTLEEGDEAELTLETAGGDALIARALTPSLGDSHELVFELPESRSRATDGGGLELEVALAEAPGVRVSLTLLEGSEATFRVGLIGASSLRTKLTALPAGKYRISLHDGKDTQFYCDPETVEIKAGAVAALTLKPR